MTKQSTPEERAREDEEIDERFQVLENKALYQDRTIDELNEVVTRQQDQIDALNAKVDRLEALLEGAGEGGVEADDSPPPHY
jgi:uncharacterized coiled-coil protein SlyX